MGIKEEIIKRIRNGDFYGNCYECDKYFLEEDFIDYIEELKWQKN